MAKNDSADISMLFVKSLGFPGGAVVKNPPANVGDASLIPGLGEMATHPSILAWEIPWTEEPGEL